MRDDFLRMALHDRMPEVDVERPDLRAVARRASRLRLRRVAAVALVSAILAAGLVLPLVFLGGIGSGPNREAPGGQGTDLSGFGLSAQLPDGWNGRVLRQGEVSYLEAANYRLPPTFYGPLGSAQSSDAPNAMSLVLADETSICPCGGWGHAQLPPSVTPNDFGTNYEGLSLGNSLAPLQFVTNGRWIDVWIVSADLPPGETQVRQVNELLGTLEVSADTGWTTHSDSNDAVSVAVPDGWTYREDPVPNLSEPRILFAAGTWAFPEGGECGPNPALSALPNDGALVWLMEYSRGEDPSEFPGHPLQFSLDGTLVQPECTPARPQYIVRFDDGWRYFQFHVALGDQAPASIRQDVLNLMDSFSVGPLPEDETLSRWLYLCDKLSWVKCPLSDWVRNTIWAAGYSVGDPTDSAIAGTADGSDFLMWTTPDQPSGASPSLTQQVAQRTFTPLTDVDGTTVYGNGNRAAWHARSIDVWVQAGPTSGALPSNQVLSSLVRASLNTRFG